MSQASTNRPLPTTASWRPWLAAIALLALVAVVYWPATQADFIYDDTIDVRDNVHLRSLSGLSAIWFQLGAVDQYYPLTYTTFWIEYHLWGLNWPGFHIVNLALHASSVLLLWRLLARLAVPGAWLAAAIFAVHPVGVETVAWVSERKNLLSSLLALASIVAYLRFAPPEPVTGTKPSPIRGSWPSYGLALLLFAGALLAKTVTVSVPAVLLVVYWWKRGRITLRDVTPLVPFFAIGIALCLVTIRMENSLGTTGDTLDLSWLARVLLASRALCFYAGKIVWPYPLIWIYPRWTIDTSAAWQYVFPAVVLAIIAGLWLLRNRVGRGPLATVLIFCGVLVPGIGFFNTLMFRTTYVADHYQYHAMAALIALLVAGVVVLVRHTVAQNRKNGSLLVVASLWLVALAALAHVRTFVFRDNLTLARELVAQDPNSWLGHHGLALSLTGGGNSVEGFEHFRRAIAIRQQSIEEHPQEPSYRDDLARCYTDLAAAQERLGLLHEAESSYRESLRIRQDLVAADPAQPRYQNQVAASYVDLGLLEQIAARPADAERSLRKALTIRQRLVKENPRVDEFRDGLGWCYVNLALLAQDAGRGQEAWDLDQQAIAVRKKLAEAHPSNTRYANQLATSYADRGLLERALGRLDEARKSLAEVIAIRQRLVREEPTVTEFRAGLAAAYEDLASVCRAAGDLAEAEDAYRHSIQERESLARDNPTPDNQDHVAATYVDLGLVQRERHELQDARQSFARAVALRRQLVEEHPQALPYRDGLAWCYQHLADAQRQGGQLPEALASYRLALAQRQTLAQSEPANADYRARLEAVQASCDEVQRALELRSNGRQPPN